MRVTWSLIEMQFKDVKQKQHTLPQITKVFANNVRPAGE